MVALETRDPELTPSALEDRVVWGAMSGDLVQLHGAITAALNLYPRGFAYARVFAPALDRLDAETWQVARAAINLHLLDPNKRRPPRPAIRG